MATVSMCMQDAGLCNCNEMCQGANNLGRKMTFGLGTKLIVKPNTAQTIPSVYPLTPDKKEEGFPDTVCLVTDFSSPNKTIAVDEEDTELSDIAALDKSSNDKWRYSSVIWDRNDPTKKLSCTVKYDNQIVSPDNIDETTDTCLSPTVSLHFRTNPGMNTLSTSVLGLRILTAKAIIFNLIMTMRLWSS